MSFLGSQKKAPSPLAYHRTLSPSASIKVSPICLGSMNFGDTEPFKSLLGECDKATAFSILDHFFAMGGNFLDCANMYHGGQSEQWLGEWMVDRKVREQMVVATKYSNPSRMLAKEKEHAILTNYVGSNRKSLKLSLERSLESLQTSYIDILYVHAWDPSCEVEELMRSLDDVVRQGKVLYLGVSNWPAWMVVKANEYARSHGLTPFVVYEGRWNAADRDIERDILPMLKMEGMGLAVWSPLGGGKFKAKSADHDGRKIEGILGEAPTATFQKIGKVMAEIGKAKGFDEIAVALRYVMLKAPYVIPIIGGRKVHHLDSNIQALKLNLTEEEIAKIDAVNPFYYGYPYAVMSGDPTKTISPSDLGSLFASAGWFEGVKGVEPIRNTV